MKLFCNSCLGEDIGRAGLILDWIFKITSHTHIVPGEFERKRLIKPLLNTLKSLICLMDISRIHYHFENPDWCKYL